jgi:predicted small secreted protein
MFHRLVTMLLLVVTLFLAACSTAADVGSRSAADASQDVAAAALTGLTAIGWDTTGFTAETELVDGDFARVTIHSSDPPGGFTVFLQQKDGWQVIAHGSGYNPVELHGLGIPDSVLGPQWSRDAAGAEPSHEEIIAGAALLGLDEIGWDTTGFTAATEAINGDYARVRVESTDPPGGFTAFLAQGPDGWKLIAHGSAFNPADLQGMGVPDSLLP